MKLNQIIQGDSLEVLKTLPDESVDCMITSPPYWGLRDYGTAKWEGGDEKCKHIQRNNQQGEEAVRPYQEFVTFQYKDICGKCGAERIDNQLGLEKTPEEYVSKMVEVFGEVKRVLKKEGTCFLNLGDSYWGGGFGTSPGGDDDFMSRYPKQASNRGTASHETRKMLGSLKKGNFLKPKDLCGIPWRVAFALQTDGWYLRQDIIWAKPNPMPESVTDRCTKSHEYIFLLTKSPKYYFDNEAIKEKTGNEANWDDYNNALGSNEGADADRLGEGYRKHSTPLTHPNGRNKRSVWTVTTKPFKEAHFATFPEDLITPMVLAGCPKDGIVLDPFMGAGTTAVVAKKLGRNYLGIELNPEYCKIAEDRLRGTTSPML